MESSQFTKAEDLKTNILNDIDFLVKLENELTQSMENTQLTLTEKNKITDKIKTISDMRIKLYDILDEINGYLQFTLTNATNTLIDQTYALNIIENEIQLSRDKLQFIQEDKYNKYRQVEINTYYSQKYSDHNKLMLWIIAVLAIITLIVFLNKKNIISYTIFFWLLLVTIVLGVIIIMYKLINMSIRNNMNYQEYDINMDTTKYKNTNKEYVKNTKDPWETTTITSPICPTSK